jgi:TonB family protein
MSEMHASLHDFLAGSSSAVLSHLWLSTLVLALALIAALGLPRLRARTRFLIVFLGLAKFFVPSGLLIWLSESARTKILTMLGWEREQLPVAVSFIFDSPVDMNVYAGTASELACIVFLAWASGAGALFAMALVRRRILLHHLFSSSSEPAAREARIFARIQSDRPARKRASLRTTKATTSPAVVGVLRPIVFLPQGSTDSLSDAEVESVLTHEIAHILRFDNLTAVLQMIASALFWFHPLVWFAHVRLLIERELACDEAVIDLELAPADYVSGVLKICRRAAAPRVAAVACMRSAHLSERMEYVMRYGALRSRLFSHRKVSLLAAGVVVLATVAAASIGGVLPASASTPPPYSMTATVIEVRPGIFRCDIEVRDVKGVVIAAPRLQIAGGDVGTMSTSSGDRLIQIRADLNENGNGPITLEVRENDLPVANQTLFAIAQRTGESAPGDDMSFRPINLSLKDADLSDVLRTFSQLTGMEVITEPGLNGKVTIELTQTPWPQALARILHPLGMTFAQVNGRIEVKRMNRSDIPGVFRVGGDVVAPRAIQRVPPIYPAEARKARVVGVVVLEAIIDETGTVDDVRVLRGLPFGLSEAATDAVRQWKFAPATKSGVPVPVIFNLTMNFRLDSEVPSEGDAAINPRADDESSEGRPHRVEGNVIAPRLLSRVDPQYTPDARAHRVAGVVIIEAHIDESGRVVDTRILKNLPFGLGEAAVNAVRQWIFEPATLDGRPVPVIFNLTVNFRPDGEVAF